MKHKELYDNYLKSLNQKYNAVCFDIDGTLTIKESKSIDPRAITMIINLLKRKIPVVFITGRGETGLNDLKNDIFNQIRSDSSITDNDIKRIYVLTNDGARLFYSNGATEEDFLKENTYISTKEELEELNKVNEFIKEKIRNSVLDEYLDITYSKDLKTKQIINIRLRLFSHTDCLTLSLYDDIGNFIKKAVFKSIVLTKGQYKDRTIFQIGTATKDKAIEKTEEIIGVPKDSMMRIGDCGDIIGNDFQMLNCSQGYSVNKTYNLPTIEEQQLIRKHIDELSINKSCFPVFDNQGNIIKGVDATLHLVDKAKILPTVCLEKADKNTYKHNFASIERNMVAGSQSLIRKYNLLFNLNFYNTYSVDDLFDKYSGSVKIPMYEMELTNNNPLKEFWLTQENNHNIYSLRDDENYLLRGSSTYYYLLANREIKDEKDITTNKNVLNWYNNYLRFLNDAKNSIEQTDDIKEKYNRKMILGILDNCRNVLLVLLNHILVSDYCNKNILFDISSSQSKMHMELYRELLEVEQLMSTICFEKNTKLEKDILLKCVQDTKTVLEFNFINELNKEEKKDYSKDYRAYREIDNFAQNYITVKLYKEKQDNQKYVNACGLSYGGIELPIIAKIIDKDRIEKQLILKFNNEVSGYSNKQLIDLRKFDINNFGGIIEAEKFKDTDVDLFDDNVLTGKTLQLAINSLYDCNINVKNICIVRYPNINRIDQMFLDNPSAVDYNLFFDYIYGLCFNSPYSWKDNSWEAQDGRIDYTDSFGVFDLNRKKIIDCLIKNHDYNEKSEVGLFKRRVKK